MAATPNLSSSAANAAAAKNRIPGVCDCTDPVDKAAVILYPSLGTPLLLAEGQSKCSIFIAADAGLRQASGAGNATPSLAPNMHVFADRHLRLYSIDAKDTQTDTTTGTLFGDGKTCGQAQPAIQAWRVGTFAAGALIRDRHGRPFATVAPMAAQVYTDIQGGDIYELELDLRAAPFAKISAGKFMSFAWMIKLDEAGRKLLPDATHAEPQDLMIARFLQRQVAGDPYHFKNIHEFEIGDKATDTAARLPSQKKAAADRLRSWHPVKYMPARALKLGHLSDVHVNVRHTAMGKSPARVLEGDGGPTDAWNRPVGQKVCNAFDALHALFDKMADGPDKADAVLLTGDLIDFNRNIDPGQMPAGIGEQWKNFNLLANIFDKDKGPRLYPRGLDDMLVYSLVRHVYREHKLPVFMTSGNHEAYQVPYGISARVESGDMSNWAFKLGVLEAQANPGNLEKTIGSGAAAAAQGAANIVDPPWSLPNLKRMLRDRQPLEAPVTRITGATRALEEHKKMLEAASAWTRGKANEGMSRDHNMPIYEACLAYGPTYGQVLTGYNFDGGQFDWFYALFTPLADVTLAYGAESTDASGAGARQAIAALGWGTKENFMNIVDKASPDSGADRQGAGILPRAVESFSADQLALVEQGQKYKKASTSSLTVASHFTIVSFDEPEPYSIVSKNKERASFWPANGATGLPDAKAAFNHVNVGTCEKNLAAYFDLCVHADSGPKGPAAVDWHLSGHSHRSGVYQVQRSASPARAGRVRYADAMHPRIQVVSAKDPGIHGAQTVTPNGQTALIVSSCGGPIGYQNLDGELSAWTGRPPAGSLLDCATGKITQVSTSRSRVGSKSEPFNEKPRLAVALDYLHVMSGLPDKGDIKTPLSFILMKEGLPKTVNVLLSEQMLRLDCIDSIALWLFEGGGTDEKNRPLPKKWNRLTPEFKKGKAVNDSTLSFSDDDVVKLNLAVQAGPVGQYPNRSKFEPGAKYKMVKKAFCEVTLTKPANTAAGEDWAKDVVYDQDPWVFPLNISIGDAQLSRQSYWMFARPAGQMGEVPDWDWLADTFADKGYIPAKEAITGKNDSTALRR